MKKLTTEEFVRRATNVHKGMFDYSLTNYINSGHKVTVICERGHKVEQNPNDHLRGIGCKICHRKKLGDKVRRPLQEVVEQLTSLYGDRYKFDFTDYVNTGSIITISCKDHGSKKFRVQGLLNGYECTECKGTKPGKLTLDYFLRQVKKVHGTFYSYKRVSLNGCKNKITIGCPVHGDFLQSSNAHLRGQGCPKCKTSKGETKVRMWLEKNNIKYISQHRFELFKRSSYDFYLPNLNICIEYDGEYHFHAYPRVGGDEGLRIRQERDRKKDQFCIENGIKLLRIAYWDFKNIETILEKTLNM